MVVINSCPICGLTNWRNWARVEGYVIVQCSGCGFRFVNSRPDQEDQRAAYDQNYYEGMTLPREKAKRSYFARRLLELPNTIGSGESLLDVGAGTGIFLDVARALGWEVRGVEPSRWAAEYARKQRHLNVECGEIRDVDGDQSFDLITLWEVLEHIRDPVGALRHAHRLLRKDGLLVLTVPNSRGPVGFCHWGKELMPWWHLCHFTPRTLQLALEKAGFRLRRFRTFGVHGLFASLAACVREHQPDAIRPSLPFRLTARALSPLNRVIGTGCLSGMILNAFKANDRIVAYATRADGGET